MPKALTPEEIIDAYLSRLVKISEYAKREDVSITEAHRRADGGKIVKRIIGGVAFIVLPAPPAK